MLKFSFVIEMFVELVMILEYKIVLRVQK